GTRGARYRPVVLCVLDGWGIAPDGPANAVTRAKTPRLRALRERYPHATLEASGRAVGLPDGIMGNSEVGHLTMGAGYVRYQELVRINDAIDDGSFFTNGALRAACAAARAHGTLHLMGLLSTGGVHADLRHLTELVEPRVVGAGAPIADRDAVIFFNFRPDRARQLTWALMQPDFTGFVRARVPRDLTFVSFTEYKVGLPNVLVAFMPQEVVPMAG